MAGRLRNHRGAAWQCLVWLGLLGCGADDDGRHVGGAATSGIGGVADDGETNDTDSLGDTSDGESEDDSADTGNGPNADVCGNGIDDDADGAIDEQCACIVGETQPCFPEGAGDPCPGTQTCEGAGEITAWGGCEVLDDECEPAGTSGGDPCSRPHETATQILTFQSPLQTVGPCPWGQGDNLPPINGVMAARHEDTQPLAPPEGAVLCATRFEVPETSMYYDDQLYLVFNDVLIFSPGDWSGLLTADGDLLLYDWMKIRGSSGNGITYCPGAGSLCELPNTEQNGSIELELDEPTQAALLQRAAEQGYYEVTVATAGDNNASDDCDHSTFNLEVTYEYVIE